MLVPWLAPKFVPVITKPMSGGPCGIDKAVILGVTVNKVWALPLGVVTTRLPVLAPAGTAAKIAPGPQLLKVAVTPLNFTVLVPWVDPKLVPVMITTVPIGPLSGDAAVTVGAVDMKLAALLD